MAYPRVQVNLRLVSEQVSMHPSVVGKLSAGEVATALLAFGVYLRSLPSAAALAVLAAFAERAQQHELHVQHVPLRPPVPRAVMRAADGAPPIVVTPAAPKGTRQRGTAAAARKELQRPVDIQPLRKRDRVSPSARKRNGSGASSRVSSSGPT